MLQFSALNPRTVLTSDLVSFISSKILSSVRTLALNLDSE